MTRLDNIITQFLKLIHKEKSRMQLDISFGYTRVKC